MGQIKMAFGTIQLHQCSKMYNIIPSSLELCKLIRPAIHCLFRVISCENSVWFFSHKFIHSDPFEASHFIHAESISLITFPLMKIFFYGANSSRWIRLLIVHWRSLFLWAIFARYEQNQNQRKKLTEKECELNRSKRRKTQNCAYTASNLEIERILMH